MNSNNQVTIHECTYTNAVCENYLCRQSFGKKKYFIGPEHGASQKPVFCEDCIQHMVQHIPSDLSEDQADLEARIREEIEQKYATEFAAKEEERTALMNAFIEEQKMITEAALPVIAELNEDGNDQSSGDVEEDKDEITYRCLDCGEEFETPQALGSHKRVHKEDSK